jgi:L-lactate dehydrogenase complex protein LldG
MRRSEPNPVIEAVRAALGRPVGAPVPERPAIVPPRAARPVEAEIDLLLAEIEKLSGQARRVAPSEIDVVLGNLVAEHAVQRATVWPTPRLIDLGIEARLRELGVEIVSPHADKREMAQCDLGVTEADVALPETGTLGLFSSSEKPRAVSLLPRIHLALVRPEAIRTDLHQVFAEARSQPYLVFITGPSRTADIELTVTLGVHGPQVLCVWVVPLP